MFFDSHCHLDLLEEYIPIEQILSDSRAHDVTHFLNPATHIDAWSHLIELNQTYSQITIALGLHPCFLEHHKPEHLEALKTHLTQHNILFIGEIGLDKRFKETYLEQKFYFEAQLKIASQLKKPVIIHAVRAHQDILDILNAQKFEHGGIIHAFYGSYEQAMAYIQLGFKIGIGGLITYPKNKKLHDVVKRIPLEAIVLETDSPDMPIHQQKLAYNMPCNIPKIFEKLCALRDEQQATICAQIHLNLPMW